MRKLLLLSLVLMLSACATPPKTSYQQASSSGKFPQNWQVEGRIAFKSPEEKFSAFLDWQQQQQDYQLRLSKLIGGTLLFMEQINGRVLLEIDDNTFTDSNAERLIYEKTGWQIPVADFKYWITGRLNPNSNAVSELKRDETGRIWSFSTATGWRIKYQNYKVFSGTALPHNLVLSKDNLQLKLRISEWSFNSQ
ncbi:lipoprotein insertase outer membrane protein LolB [Planctobacterium marinum]|uniref:lipoprotein insertase outer membrane protein LolB n=1 Tax=Planctobacterium marinum TaxID=1631968 RepID=UPI0030C6AB06